MVNTAILALVGDSEKPFAASDLRIDLSMSARRRALERLVELGSLREQKIGGQWVYQRTEKPLARA